MKIKFKELEIEDLEEILERINENNYKDFSTFKKAINSVCGRKPRDIFDDIFDFLYTELGLDSDADLVSFADIDELYNFLTSLDEEDYT